MRRLSVLTWHTHGNYLYYLSHADCDFYIPRTPEPPEGDEGHSQSPPWPENLIEVPADRIRELKLDCVVFQSRKNYEQDQFEILSAAQQRLPKIYIEHHPPREHPTDTRHIVDDPNVLLVHVTHYNRLMWDNNRTPTTVIEHGVKLPSTACYCGDLSTGIVVVNGLPSRGRQLGADVVEQVRAEVPLQLAGSESEQLGGLGPLSWGELPRVVGRHRFFFNPIRYTSLGLAVCEALMLGIPVVGLATTEMVHVIENGRTGFVSTDLRELIDRMRELRADHRLATLIGAQGRVMALERFSVQRFANDWLTTLHEVSGVSRSIATPRQTAVGI